MKKKLYLITLLLTLLSVIFPARAALAAEDGENSSSPVQIEIKVSEDGFNGKNEYSLEAFKGQQVEIVFIWDENKQPANTHVMSVEGYDQKTGLLNKDNHRQTVRFVASKDGAFRISCIFPCMGHNNLQKAVLTVKAQPIQIVSTTTSKEPSAAETLDKSSTLTREEIKKTAAPNLSLSMPNKWYRGGEASLSAMLATNDGKPIRGENVTFYLDYSFFLGLNSGKVSDMMEIGKVTTDENGIARLKYTPRAGGEVKFQARYNGSASINASGQPEAILSTTSGKIEDNGYRFYRSEAGIPMPSLVHYSLAETRPLYPSAPSKHLTDIKLPALILGLLIAGIWFTYIRVAYGLWRISRVYTMAPLHGAGESFTQSKFFFPIILMIFLSIFALTLLSIIFTGPDTHLNLH